MRSSIAMSGAAALVATLLLTGGWLLLGGREPNAVVTATPASVPPAPLTELQWPPDPSGLPSVSRRPEPYPTVPSAQVRAEDEYVPSMRTGAGGRQLLILVIDSDCASEEVRLLGEHADRVDVEIRTVAKPPPPGVSVAPDGSYGCASFSYSSGPHAAVELHAPLGERMVVIHREPDV